MPFAKNYKSICWLVIIVAISAALYYLNYHTDNSYTRKYISKQLNYHMTKYNNTNDRESKLFIIKSLMSNWSYERMCACSVLKSIKNKDSEFSNILIKLIHSEDYVVKLAAVQALAYTSDITVEYNNDLISLIKSSHGAIPRASMKTYLQLNSYDKTSIDILKQMAVDRPKDFAEDIESAINFK